MNPRADLLALTLEDLMVLSNRGLVKRAQRELSAGQLTYDMTETEGEIQITWSDEVVCTLPLQAVLCDRHCTCTATTLCRHLIRSVLTYQSSITASSVPIAVSIADPLADPTAATASDSSAIPNQEQISLNPSTSPFDDTFEQPSSSSVWNPGEISDIDLSVYFRPAQLNQLKREFESGQVIEVTCSYKPTAQLHNFPHTLRFLVPHDLRYTYCDCAYDSPCPHVPLAIWAFRQLSSHQQSGLISTEATTTDSIPTALLDDIEKALCDLVNTGLQGLSPGFMASLQQLKQRCDRAHLIWPANALADLIQTLNLYRNRDARFAPEQVTKLIAELCIRCDAIRSNKGSCPQLFVRGPHSTRLSDLGAARLIGLGCSARVQNKGFTLDTYFQDTDSGKVLSFSSNLESLANSEESDAHDLWKTAQKLALKQIPWSALGSGQLLIKRAACSPSHQLKLKRNQPVVVNPQRFEWEKLRSPTLVDDFLELQRRLQALPPKALRPRRLSENFYVFAISTVEKVAFSTVEQAVTATLYDQHGNSAHLSFPYTNHTHDGTEAVLAILSQHTICFISGQVSIDSMQMTISPTAIVFEQQVFEQQVFEQHSRRQLLQPWIYNAKSQKGLAFAIAAQKKVIRSSLMPQVSPIQQYLQSLSSNAAAYLISGLATNQNYTAKSISQLVERGTELGFQQMAYQLASLSKQLDNTRSSHGLAQAYLKILVLMEAL